MFCVINFMDDSQVEYGFLVTIHSRAWTFTQLKNVDRPNNKLRAIGFLLKICFVIRKVAGTAYIVWLLSIKKSTYNRDKLKNNLKYITALCHSHTLPSPNPNLSDWRRHWSSTTSGLSRFVLLFTHLRLQHNTVHKFEFKPLNSYRNAFSRNIFRFQSY